MDSTGALGHESTLASPALVSECCQGLAARSSPRELNTEHIGCGVTDAVDGVTRRNWGREWIQDVMERSNTPYSRCCSLRHEYYRHGHLVS